MYKCRNCGEYFEEPDTYRECMGEFWGTPAYEEFSCCPHCGDDCIEEYEEPREPEYYEVYGFGDDGKEILLDKVTDLEEAVTLARSEDDMFARGCSIYDDADNEVEWR